MKVLLLAPSTQSALASPRYRRLFPHLLPHGLAYLGACLERESHEVRILDQLAECLSNEDAVERARVWRPEVIGISVLTASVGNVAELVPAFRSAVPAARIVLGNAHASLFVRELLASGLGDIVVHGEGEATLPELVARLAAGAGLAGLAGVSYRENGSIESGPPRPPLADLDALPDPAWHLFDLTLPAYREIPMIGLYDTPFPVLASRGCAYHCLFCSQDKAYKKPRYRRVEGIVDEIERVASSTGLRTFGFNDAYFPWDRESGLAFSDDLIRRGLARRLKWVTETRVDALDAELVAKMRQAGLSTVFLGYEVGNQRILDSLGKGTTLEQGERAARLAHEAGVRTVGFFMLGLPGETCETCWETVRYAERLDLDFVKFAIAVPYPGSRFYEMVKPRLALTKPERFNSWYNWATDGEDLAWAPEGMTARELLNIQRFGMFEYYFRPRMIWKHLRKRTTPWSLVFYGAWVLARGLARAALTRLVAARPRSKG